MALQQSRIVEPVTRVRRLALLLWGTALLLALQLAPARAQTSSMPTDVIQVPASELPKPPAATCPPPDGTRPDPTLVNTDPFVLDRFPLQRVYKQLLRLAHVSGPSAVELFQQMWDSMDQRASAKFKAPHCDDSPTPNINGFPIECPRPEAVLKDSNPQSFVPVALMNRFDLSPATGANCGEYRMIYAMSPFSKDNRNFIIFEGTLPNPTPACGIDACRPVVEFWQSLAAYDPSKQSGKRALADGLERFFFYGLPGFEPVIDPNHYGLREGASGYGAQSASGQIRTNMFVTGTLWQLREFQLAKSCRNRSCRLFLRPVSIKNNPFPAMFDVSDPAPDPRAGDFQATFPSQVEALSSSDVNLISMNIDDRFNAGQSTSSSIIDDYEIQMQNSAPNDFTAAVGAELARTGHTDLSALDIAERATTQSCAGCHQLAVGLPLSLDGTGGPVWPPSRPDGFVHVDEHGFLSEALWCHFLPFRKGVLDGFFESAPQSCDGQGRAKHGGPRAVVVSNRASSAVAPVFAAAATDAATTAAPAVDVSQLTICGKVFGPN